MRLAKYRPFKTEFPVDQVMDKIFGTQLSEVVGGRFTTTTPPTNITDLEDGYQIQLAIPGLAKKEVNIQVLENTLIVKGEKTVTSQEENYDRREFDYSSFERRFFLGDDIDQDNIIAKHKNGVLTIALTKDKSKAETKTVVIK